MFPKNTEFSRILAVDNLIFSTLCLMFGECSSYTSVCHFSLGVIWRYILLEILTIEVDGMSSTKMMFTDCINCVRDSL